MKANQARVTGPVAMANTQKEAAARAEDLRQKVSLLPRKPGVYIFRDSSGEIIYVGKAKVLANRVRTYFADSYDDGRLQIHALVRSIADLEVIATSSETEALVLEATLVKKHAPRYNIRLKDDKKYPYLLLTNEAFPRLVFTRSVRRGEGRYFGPYTDTRALRRTQELLHRLFPLRTCTSPLPSPSITRVCLQYEIKRCKGPCVGLQTQEEYATVTNQAERFLRGQISSVVRELEQEMDLASERLQFERAAELRDRLNDIRTTAEKQSLADARGEDRDVVALTRDDTEAVAVVLEIREGKLIARKDYSLSVGLDEPVEAIMGAFLRQYYLDAMAIPRELAVMCEPEDAHALEELLGHQRGGIVRLQTPRRGEKTRLVDMARQNAEMLLAERRLRREKFRGRVPHSVRALERDLRLPRPPRRIACFDISHIQGTDTVGSLVVFQDGRPLKNAYRMFQIRGVSGSVGESDDFAAIREVVERAFSRLAKDTEEARPDLVIVDGGKGQLSSAKAVLDSLGFGDQPVIGLAKRLEEVFLPGCSEPQTIPRTSSGLKLLQQVRDEAHRFAIGYHRKKRGRAMSVSALDEVPGIGIARKRALLRKFRSLASLLAAPEEEIAAVEGIGPVLAATIRAVLLDGRTGGRNGAQSPPLKVQTS
ncbi:MAG TPA: excinuclease ABC subunit UvrC [Candidatus Latescibacteria bacterium]|nr:excinuclease ABC subunit UvrC [Candidatus Latescibacterota bacterium]HRS93894.1 excinuclease ABC subunit UvrC [Candidatus Latescibacterota bacterium]